MRILSIDFDYFQQVSKETMVNNYPDGHDLPPVVSASCWIGHYGDKDYPVEDVKVNQVELSLLKDLLKDQKRVKEVMIALSHVSIYDFITHNAKHNEKIEIVNLDMHHDMFNDNEEVDCGNWVSRIGKKYPMALAWVVNPVSESLYGLDGRFKPLLLHSIADLKDIQYDYIFLCRSDQWLPPHLDKEFDDLRAFMIKALNCPILIEKGLEIDRMEVCEDIQKQIQDCIASLRNPNDIIERE